MTDTLTRYKEHLREIGKLSSSLALLHWDQRTHLPEKGHAARAEVIGKLAKMVFELSISDDLGRYIEELETRDDLSPQDKASVRVVGRDYRRHKAIPPDLFEKFAIARSKSETAWEKAKAASDFAAFRPHLEEMIDYSRQFAEYYGYKENPYDALIEDYEPGMTAAKLKEIIAPLRDALVPFIKRLGEDGTKPRTDFIRGSFPEDKQQELSLHALSAIGYDFHAGRLDTTVHPFTIGVGPGDVRITTRFLSDDPFSGLYSSIHEGGHALYEQGIPDELRWTGLDDGASMGIHESQSRMWENMVGRSRAFWEFFTPITTGVFSQLSAAAADDLYRAVNVVEPSLVRVEADEVTYNLHIMLRFELEEGLINGRIAVNDLPQLWNEAMDRYLGVTPADDAHGVLQDVHWSGGMLGYFPSYMLGNLYAAQLFAAAHRDIPGLEEDFARGEFSRLLTWLREKIHQFGRIYDPIDLLERVTGEKPDSKYFIDYITQKYSEIYKI